VLHVADVVQDHPGVAIELRDKLGQPQIPLGGEQPLHQTGCRGLELGIPPGNRRGPERLQPLHEQRATPLEMVTPPHHPLRIGKPLIIIVTLDNTPSAKLHLPHQLEHRPQLAESSSHSPAERWSTNRLWCELRAVR
jgi:hypothetical protein